MKKGRIMHNFPGSNTPEGFKGFMDCDLAHMERIFVLKGGPGCGKSTLMKKIAQNMADRGYDVEVWMCSSAPESLDGVVIGELAVAVVDGTAPHIVEPKLPGVVEEIVNLGEHWNQSQLREHKDEIRQLAGEIQQCFERAYAQLAQGEEARRSGEYELPEDLTAGQLAQGLAEEIFGQERLRVRRFFAEAFTREGRQSYAQELSAACERRYLLAGGPREVDCVLRQIAQEAYAKGHNMDLYYSCFQPELLEMVVLPGLSVALVASFCPELEPRYEDVLLRLGDEPEPEAGPGYEQWQACMAEAAAQLAEEHRLHDELESFYIEAMDFEGIDEAARDIFGKIWAMAAENKRSF